MLCTVSFIGGGRENHRQVTDKLTAEDRIRCKLGKTVLDT
jgi:hypothetical protein